MRLIIDLGVFYILDFLKNVRNAVREGLIQKKKCELSHFFGVKLIRIFFSQINSNIFS